MVNTLPRPQTPNKVLSKQIIQLCHHRRFQVKPLHGTVSCGTQPGKGCQGPDVALAKVIPSREPGGGGVRTMEEDDYNRWFLSYGMSALDESDRFSCVIVKQGVAPTGSQDVSLARSGEFSSSNAVSSSVHSIFWKIVDWRQNITLGTADVYGLRGSNLCDICDKVLWLSITFNCRT